MQRRRQLFFSFLANLNLLYKWSNKQICYKETPVRSNHPMMILLCILYVMLGMKRRSRAEIWKGCGIARAVFAYLTYVLDISFEGG
jgi:hypothetical protein